MTGMVCTGDAKGLTGNPQVASEVPDGYLSGRLETPEKCGILPWSP